MADIASNVLYTLLMRELTRQGIALPVGPALPAPTEGVVAQADKSGLLEQVRRNHGALPLLRVGQGIRHVGYEPTLQALLMAADPVELLSRWQRLERYVHSHHRIVMRDAGPGWVVLEHLSIRDGSVPTPGEDYLILGLLLALFQETGATDLSACLLHPAGLTPICQDGRMQEPTPTPPGTARWRIGWTQGSLPLPPRPVAAAALAFPPEGEVQVLIDRITVLVLADCSRVWTLGVVARMLGLSTRTLQRRLTQAHTSFAAIVRSAQVRRATELLLSGTLGVAEVGLLCGFSDQAHFTREFKRRTNIPPARYRAEFAP